MRSMKMMMKAALVLAAGVGASAATVSAQSTSETRAAREVLARARAQMRVSSPVMVEVLAMRAPQAMAASEALAAMAPLARVQSVARARRVAEVNMSALAAVDAWSGIRSARGGSFATTPPEAWLQEDPGSEAYQAARETLNRRRYRDAAAAFAALRRNHPRSGYVGDSMYWQAFALFREGGRQQLMQATELLTEQARDYANANTRQDADELRVRIEAQLASRGDSRAAAVIAAQAAGPCDEEQEVRMAALSALLNMNAERAVPILQEVLRSRDVCSVELRRRAVFLLSQKMSDESVDILLDLAHRNPDPDPEVREQAVFWLHQVRTPEALDALESILTESDDPELQERAIFAMSQRSGDSRAIEVLKSYALRADVPRELRENAIFWISQNAEAGGAAFLIELYPSLDDAELRERAVFGIAQAPGGEGRAWLMARAMDASEEIDLRKNALFWAGQTGKITAAELRGVYRSVEDTEMKEQVIFVASQRNEREVVDFLMEVAREEADTELKSRAIFWLGQSKDPRVTEFLLSIIRG